MKKVIIAFISGVVISMSSVAVAANQFNVSLFPSEFFFNGVKKPVPSEYEVFNYNGHVYVPIRYVTESMGATVGFTSSPDNKPNQITIDYKEVGKNSDNPSGYVDSEKKISVSFLSINQTSRGTALTGQVQLNDSPYTRNNVTFNMDITLKDGKKLQTISGAAVDIGKGELKTINMKSSDFFDAADIAKVEITVKEIAEVK